MKKGEKTKEGFTIIEVVLVLAVAGLIFAMVFVALPAMQRSQRDNTRRDDITKLVSEVKRFQTSNRGNLPTIGSNEVKWDNIKDSNVNATSWEGFYKKYLGERFVDPDGSNYTLRVLECNADGKTKADQACDSGVNNVISAINNDTFGNGSTYPYTLLIVMRGKCSGGDNIVKSSSPRNLAVLYRLEGSGSYCYGT